MSSQRSTTAHPQGRIHSHQHNADFTGSLLGDEIDLGDSYLNNVQATKDLKLTRRQSALSATKSSSIIPFWRPPSPGIMR